MAKIKIISNPYYKKTSFERWDDEKSEWIAIEYENNASSKLLSKEIAEGFFPFRVRQIVEQIVQDYKVPGDTIQILFEGSADEYQELEDACSECNFETEVVTERTSIGLENARDILPEVKQLFQKISPLINSSVDATKIQRDLDRFSDASSDVVPICVLGNYSVGKSTFINALIGCEILPSGPEPVTAKVYKITRSKYKDRAQVRWKYWDQDMLISFSNRETIMEQNMKENSLGKALMEGLEKLDNPGIVERVYSAITIINDFDDSTAEDDVSNLIEVDIPFTQGVLANTLHPFVIFDTPGSNSASNAKHLQVLKEAMANMTNGLPIFVCTPDSLDSTDNENLYHIIRDLDELDNRFTMIVVNKADSAAIQRRGDSGQEQARILSQAVPRNLYSGGLFYVSSVMGLGGKTDGIFTDYVYEDIYDAQLDRYRNPGNRHYRQLYQYNILPGQIKNRSDALAAEQSDLIYANSGLFSLETEIESFAGKYAAYNKCLQSQMFLRNIISTTESEIESDKDEAEDLRQGLLDHLENDKKMLLEDLESVASTEQLEGDNRYDESMRQYLDQGKDTFSHNKLKELENDFITEQENEQNYNSREKDVRDAVDTVTGNLKDNFNRVLKKPNLKDLKSIAQDIVSDVGNVVDKSKIRFESRRDVNKAAGAKLLEYVGEVYTSKLDEMHILLDTQSQTYWREKTEIIREALASIVTGSETLTDERREELERIILTFQQIIFNENAGEEIFNKGKFEYRIQIGNRILWESDRLNIDKIVRTYNTNMETSVNTLYESFKASHTESAHAWIRNLMDEISKNIVDYSPELSKQAEKIRRMTKRIEDLQERRIKLEQYTGFLNAMMDWKSVDTLRA